MLKSDLWRNILETYGTRIVLMIIGLTTTVLAARALGPTGRGLFAVAGAVSAIGVQFGNFGLHASNTYYVAKDRALLPALIGNTLVISFGVGGLGALLCWTLFAFWPEIAPLRSLLLVLALASIPFGLAYMLLQNLLLGIQQVRAYNVIELLSKIVGLAFLALAIISGKISVEILFGATVVAVVLSFLWLLWCLRKFLHRAPVPSLPIFRRNIGLGLKAYAVAFFAFLLLRIDLVMVKYILGAQLAGYYSISETMAENMLMLPIVVGVILFPKLSEMAHRHEKLRLTQQATLLTAALLLPMVVLASVFAKPLVGFVFGKSFLPAVPAFVWLMPGSFFLGIEVVMVQYLNSLGYPRVIVYSWIVVTTLNIGVNLWAIPAYGITGAAIVSSISYFLVFVLVLAAVWKANYAPVSTEVAEVPLCT
jgi:O-antigen/teichoic acid export membrane protein